MALGALPTAKDLDNASASIPIVLTRIDGHCIWVNTAAMQGISIPHADPPGGLIVRDSTGAPTGIFVNNAVSIILDHVPEPTAQQRKEAILAAVGEMSRNGFTGVHDMGMDPRDIPTYEAQTTCS
jgi:predicted amidohydrolase YtcJ